ncbi:MAG: hypothetical protein HND47_06675 [Chloroflexi bacterium]|nr:hypothetical protein [Chloroflexota bacterium]
MPEFISLIDVSERGAHLLKGALVAAEVKVCDGAQGRDGAEPLKLRCGRVPMPTARNGDELPVFNVAR